MNEHLPPLPTTSSWRLTTVDQDRLDRRYKLSYSVKNCITCEGAKTFRWWSQVDSSQIATYDCNCVDQFKMHRYFLAHGVPINYQQLGWDDILGADEKSIMAVGNYVLRREDYCDRGRGLFLHGEVGTGEDTPRCAGSQAVPCGRQRRVLLFVFRHNVLQVARVE